SNTRSLCQWTNFAAVSLLAVALAGCSSGGGGGGGSVLPPTGVTPGVPVPPGTAVNAATLTPAQFAALTPVVPVDANGNQSISVPIASAPKVTSALTNGAGGARISGLGSKSQTATATVAQY